MFNLKLYFIELSNILFWCPERREGVVLYLYFRKTTVLFSIRKDHFLPLATQVLAQKLQRLLGLVRWHLVSCTVNGGKT